MQAMPIVELPSRYWDNVDIPGPTECWPWKASLNQGYGQFWLEGTTKRAHRLAYEVLIGPIPAGLTLDHLCRNRACCNPTHLEPVTIGENVMRGDAISARYAARTHCSEGHPLVEGNLARYDFEVRKHRTCLTCLNASRRRRYARKG